MYYYRPKKLITEFTDSLVQYAGLLYLNFQPKVTVLVKLFIKIQLQPTYKNLLDLVWLNRFLYCWVLKSKISARRFLIRSFLLAGVHCIPTRKILLVFYYYSSLRLISTDAFWLPSLTHVNFNHVLNNTEAR